eukprot:2236022-Amphidinium_carterae.1
MNALRFAADGLLEDATYSQAHNAVGIQHSGGSVQRRYCSRGWPCAAGGSAGLMMVPPWSFGTVWRGSPMTNTCLAGLVERFPSTSSSLDDERVGAANL